MLRVLGMAAGLGLLGYVLPRALGTTLTAIGHTLAALPPTWVAGLLVLWAAGLVAHSFVLTAALPGLTTRRALTLNLTGSSVSNVVPFGGAAGMTLNYVMIRSWKADTSAFAAFLLVSNIWDFMLKLALPAVALIALILEGGVVSPGLRTVAVITASVLGATVVALAVGIVSRRHAEAVTRPLVHLFAAVRRLLRGHADPAALTHHVLEARDRVAEVVRRKWWQLSAGMVGYAVLQALLLAACLTAVGNTFGIAAVLAAYAVERILTLAQITPGGTGITEAGTAGVLIALGGDPTAVAAGVLLYRAITYALEIPVGGAWLGGWLWARRVRRTAGIA